MQKVIILWRFHKEPLIICGGYAKVMSYGVKKLIKEN